MNPAPRELPHSLESEEYLLSCCLLDGRAAVTRCIAAKLRAESFFSSAHGLVFEALVRMHAAQIPIDGGTLAEEMKTAKTLDQVGGYSFITQVSSRVPTTAQLGYYIGKVREQWILREIIRFGAGLVEESYAYTGEMTDWLSPKVSWLQNALVRVVHGERAGLTLRERIASVKIEVQSRADGTEDKSGWIHTGSPEFDRHLRPLGSDAEDHLIVIGGGSGHGKSALMRQWAGQALTDGQTVWNYTRETSTHGWILQMAANWARVNLKTLAEAPKDQVARLHEACDRLADYASKTLFVFQQEAGTQLLTIENFVEHVQTRVWEHGAPHLIVVDYLQLFGTEKRVGNREQEVAHVSHTLQSVQRGLRSTVMLVGAQLNEGGLKEMRAPKRDEEDRLVHRLPNAGDFRESQAIYHDADRVIAIYRPPEDCRGAENYGLNVTMPEQWLCQIKRRYGGEGAVKFWFEKPFLNFREFNRGDASSPRAAAAVVAPAGPGSGTKAEFRAKGKT